MKFEDKNSRQSFLGDNFFKILDTDFVSVVGLGGGGSIIINELAYIGFKNYFICDPDNFEESNINRLLGSNNIDIKNRTAKVEISERTILGVIPDANIISEKLIWQNCIDIKEFKMSKIIFSCLDNFKNRIQIEAFARKNKIPLIDIGLRIKKDENNQYQMMGQVILSHPDGPCFKCFKFITDRDLEIEALNYGDAGIRPQVIWPNGILASTAVGIGVEILSKWTNKETTIFYKHFEGNGLNIFNNLNVDANKFSSPFKCPHYP